MVGTISGSFCSLSRRHSLTQIVRVNASHFTKSEFTVSSLNSTTSVKWGLQAALQLQEKRFNTPAFSETRCFDFSSFFSPSFSGFVPRARTVIFSENFSFPFKSRIYRSNRHQFRRSEIHEGMLDCKTNPQAGKQYDVKNSQKKNRQMSE